MGSAGSKVFMKSGLPNVSAVSELRQISEFGELSGKACRKAVAGVA